MFERKNELWKTTTISNLHFHDMTEEDSLKFIELNPEIFNIKYFKYPQYCNRVFSTINEAKNALFTEALIRKLPLPLYKEVSPSPSKRKRENEFLFGCKICKKKIKFYSV